MQKGFKIKSFDKIEGWNVVPLSDFELHDTKCCDELEVVASLTGDGQLDIGKCKTCGHVTYVQKPKNLDEYYKSTWQKQSKEELLEIWENHQIILKNPTGEAKTKIDRYTRVLDTLERKNVLDVGCGYGVMMGLFQKLGFEVEGLEASDQRVELSSAYGITHQGKFETYPFSKKYGIIHMKHVLEHTINPDEFIAKAASLQDEGDHLVVSVPNFLGEPTMGVLLFYLHLHSFTTGSLGSLLARHGYEIVNNKESWLLEHYVVARKNKVDFKPEKVNVEKKLNVGLGFVRGESHFIWEKDFDLPVLSDTQLPHLIEAYGSFPRVVTIEPIKEFKSNSPIEIQQDILNICVK